MSSPAVDALRHSASGAYVVLDDQDRIVHVSSKLHHELGRWIGHVLWNHLPGAREVYAPTLDDARDTGRPVESVVFYAGRATRLTAIPGPDGLAVHVEHLAELDLTSLATLTRGLEQIATALADPASVPRGRPARVSPQALP
jgi:hypothetical protein